MFLYRDQRSPPLVSLSILRQMNPLHTLIHCSLEIYSDAIFHLHLDLCSGLMPSAISTDILCVFLMKHYERVLKSSNQISLEYTVLNWIKVYLSLSGSIVNMAQLVLMLRMKVLLRYRRYCVRTGRKPERDRRKVSKLGGGCHHVNVIRLVCNKAHINL